VELKTELRIPATGVRAADTAQDKRQPLSAAVSESHALPALNLSDAQRERTREAVITAHRHRISSQINQSGEGFHTDNRSDASKRRKGQTLPAEVTATIP
jgi:hypothetical protein